MKFFDNKKNLVVLFFSLLLILSLVGLIPIYFETIISFALMISGIILVYGHLSTGNKASIFWGSMIFFTGIYLYLPIAFTFFDFSSILIPSLLLMIGLSFFIVFIDSTNEKNNLIISIVFIIVSFFFMLKKGNFDLMRFFEVFYSMIELYGLLIVLALIGALILLRIEKSNKKNSDETTI